MAVVACLGKSWLGFKKFSIIYVRSFISLAWAKPQSDVKILASAAGV